jgi:hypothetical protein
LNGIKAAQRQAAERSAFLKKGSKKRLADLASAPRRQGRPGVENAFCFFFSKKKTLPFFGLA